MILKKKREREILLDNMGQKGQGRGGQGVLTESLRRPKSSGEVP